MARHKDSNWNLPDEVQDWEQVGIAVLMDIRDELKKLNGLLKCPNFTSIPKTLRSIRRKLPSPAKKEKA